MSSEILELTFLVFHVGSCLLERLHIFAAGSFHCYYTQDEIAYGVKFSFSLKWNFKNISEEIILFIILSI